MSQQTQHHPVYLTLRNSALASFAALFLILASAQYLDEYLILLAADLPLGYATDFLSLLGAYINPYTIAAGTLAGMVWIWYRHNYLTKEPESAFYEDRIFILLGGVVTALFFALLLKLSLGRARPDVLLAGETSGFFGFQTERLYHSMPSGHATAVSAAAGVLWMLYSSVSTRFLILITAMLIIAGRVILTEHYPSDLIAGIWLGGIILYWADLYHKSTQYAEPL